MKILHLPHNIASQISVTVRALQDIGVDARGLVCNNSQFCDATGVTNYEVPLFRTHPVRAVRQAWTWCRAMREAIRWADVVHWHFRASALHSVAALSYAAQLNKVRVVEFWGSDIRIPELAAADDKYMAQYYEARPHLIRAGRRTSLTTQRRFAQHGFQCLLPGRDIEPYVQRDLFPHPRRTRSRVFLADYQPQYPDPHATNPLVVHAPSHKDVKGTDRVLKAVAAVQKTHPCRFQLTHGLTRAKALAIREQCDIFLDQFIGGDYGLAACEALAFGKPTVCYIKPSILPTYPPELPIVNANPDNLEDVLRSLLEDGRHRAELGRQSRAWAEQHHDARKIAHQLVAIYEELMAGGVNS
jgi:hypothetical protein